DGTLHRRIGPNADLSAEGGMSFTADGRELLRSDAFFDTMTGKERARFTQHRLGSYTNVLSPHGKLVATGGWHGDELSVWRAADAALLTRLRGVGRTNWSAGWSSAGPVIAWGNTAKDARTRTNPLNPLEHSFDLADLEFAGVPGTQFSRATTVRGPLSLKVLPRDSHVSVMDGDQAVAALKHGFYVASCWTLIPGKDWAAIGGISELLLFDVRTAKLIRSLVGHTGHIRALAPSPDGRYLLSAASDQTMRIWDVNRDEPLLSFFFAGAEWIAWTPQGYYAASPAGENLMGWQVNNGPDKMGTFYPAAQFRKSLYRPDVIKHLLAAGSLETALGLADKTRSVKSQMTEVADVLPPFVVITSPDKPKVDVTEPVVRAPFVATPMGKHPVPAGRLMGNGRPCPGAEGLKKFGVPRTDEIRDSWSVRLSPGVNRIGVQAESTV